MTSNQPKISIITVVRNAADELENTIQSVISQNFPQIEFIIIDGGSTDSTVEVIKAHVAHISCWISEPDQGPYDAMNKGINLASGEWIIFLNAGDVFFSPDSLSGIVQQLRNEDIDAVYGDSLADYGDFNVYRKAGTFKNIWKGMIFSHQALLLKASLLKEEWFDIRYPKIADYDLVLRILRDTNRVKYEPVPLVICDAFGISNRGQACILREYYRRAKQSQRMDFNKKLYFLNMFLFLSVIDLVKMILSKRQFISIIRLFRKNTLS